MRWWRTSFPGLAAALLALAVLAAHGPAWAVTPDEILPDQALEARARAISSGLRCLVCQNQSIDDSDAPLAHDLRVLVRDRLKAGDSDDAVRDYIVARYGEFVLLKPPLSAETALLWFMPLLVLAAAGFMIWRGIAASRAAPAVAARLSPQEQADLDALLKGDNQES
jgi:cytochrome c-type biogenesis protein CcmH